MTEQTHDPRSAVRGGKVSYWREHFGLATVMAGMQRVAGGEA